jgi:hypothetical protein
VGKFSATVAAWADNAERRTLAVFRQSVQDTMHEANVPTLEGGKMRVDTGFLKGSVQASLDGMPSGPTAGVKREKGTTGIIYKGQVAGDPAELVIRKANLGDRIWVGWSANYARAREYYDGFMRSAAQNWVRTVKRSVAKVKAFKV